MLQIDNLETVYDEFILAVNGLSLKVAQGDIVALLGSNGAGKSTTLRSITGVLKSVEAKIKKGSIIFENESLVNKTPAEIVQRGITLVPEGRRVFQDLTVEENIRIGAFTRKDKHEVKNDIERMYNYFPQLEKRKSGLAGYLSGGEQQMLAIARALMGKPKLIMLDEPSMGLAPLVVEEIFSILKKINQSEGTSILIVEQNANLALKFANYGYVMENGRIVFDGPKEKLMNHDDVKKFYLGMSETTGKDFRRLKSYKTRKRWL
jgi:branched-chain amino acid transport system ATP-binding protein